MTPIKFPESNNEYGPPRGMDESQVRTVPVFKGKVEGGSCKDFPIVVVCYELTEADVEALLHGRKIYVSMIGGLAPHYLSQTFYDATHPV